MQRVNLTQRKCSRRGLWLSLRAMSTVAPPRAHPPLSAAGSHDSVAQAAAKIDVSGLNFYYGDAAGPREHPRQDPPERGDGAHRAVGLRQVDLPPHAQPDERHRARRARRGRGHHRRPRHLRAVGRCRRPAPPRRHGLPEVEPVPEVDLRQRRLRPADQPPDALARGARRPRRGQPEVGGALGRSEGPAAAPRRWRCRAASSSASASRARSPSSPRSC